MVKEWYEEFTGAEANDDDRGHEIKGLSIDDGDDDEQSMNSTWDDRKRKFFEVLNSRRAKKAPWRVTQASDQPFYQLQYSPTKCQIMSCCPKGASDHNNEFEEEHLQLKTEGGEQGIVPLIIVKVKPEKNTKKLPPTRKPAVVFLHPSYKNKEWLKPLLEAYAARGYISVGVDSRYHGERAYSNTCYIDALVSAWEAGHTFPFIYDTVWDLIKLMDYLSERKDIDPERIGITGESLGGMHAWFAAAMDSRYAAAVLITGVQSFRWAVLNNKWHERVSSIPKVFEVAKNDLQKTSIDAEVVACVWDRIAPGLTDEFDAIYTIPAIAPRPLLILNGQEDPRCPVDGLKACVAKTHDAYMEAGVPNNFKFIAEGGVGHCLTISMVQEASKWFDTVLKPSEISK